MEGPLRQGLNVNTSSKKYICCYQIFSVSTAHFIIPLFLNRMTEIHFTCAGYGNDYM